MTKKQSLYLLETFCPVVYKYPKHISNEEERKIKLKFMEQSNLGL